MKSDEIEFATFVHGVEFDDTPGVSHRDRLEHELLAALASQTPRPSRVWAIVKSPLTRLAAAAAIVAALLAIGLWIRTTPPAYALEQTIEAGRRLRRLYLELHTGEHLHRQAWLEYGDAGKVRNVRVDFHWTKDRTTVTVWKDGKTWNWDKTANRLLIFEDEPYTAKMLSFVERHDPTRAIEYIRKLEKKGDVKIKIDQPADKARPVVITADYLPNTYLIEAEMPAMREILLVDQTTKLVRSTEIRSLVDGEYKPSGIWRYDKYDKPFDSGIFDIEDELPEDVRRIDMNTVDFGLEQGELIKEQIVTKVVRAFFEALIAKNYDAALDIYGSPYADAEERTATRKKLEKIRVVRIVSVGEPVSPAPRGQVASVSVPCTVEVEQNGQVHERRLDGLSVRRVLGHSDRWRLEGSLRTR
ncbi:MAG: hypothetical protein JSU94_09450 [Phycisphaerales bacterium]|nr:MAG: hypothetical protein JSU94_09450 [Phycisphaerales bacterium]